MQAGNDDRIVGGNYMRKKELLRAFLIGSILLTGCGQQNAEMETDSGSESVTETESVAETEASTQSSAGTEIDTSTMFSDRDKEIEYDEENSARIQLSDDGSVCESDAVEISQNTVTIVDEGTYIISGTLTDGMVMVKAEDTDKVQIVLDQANISNSQSAAIYIASADKVYLTLADGSENILENGGSYVSIDENNIDAAIFSKADLTLNGTGALTIKADAGHGIVSKDDLVFIDGIYEITGAEHGIEGKDSVRIAGGSYKITSGKDGIHAENAEDESLGFVYLANGTYEIVSQGDGISAESWLLAENGTYQITTGQGGAGAAEEKSQQPMMKKQPEEETAADDSSVSIKGFKAGTQLIMEGGTYTLNTEDDSIHSNGTVAINGGDYIISSGDDGIHADAGVVISGGNVTISESYEGIEGLSIDIAGGEISITASDDGLNAAGGNDGSGMEGTKRDSFASIVGAYITISGGKVYINASGDGIDSNGDVMVSGGETYLSGPTNNGNSSLDYNGTGIVTGGIFAAAGSSGMGQNFDSSSIQGVIMITLDPQEAGTQIVLKDSAGTELLSWQASKEYSSILVSCPEIEKGGSYTLAAGTAEKSVSMDELVYGESVHMEGRPGGGRMKPEGMKPDEMGGQPEMKEKPVGENALSGENVPDDGNRADKEGGKGEISQESKKEGE